MVRVTVNGVEFDRDNIRPVEHPGKFEGELLVAEALYNAFANDGADDECGSIPETGVWNALLRGPLELGDRAEGLNEDEVGFLRSLSGAILYENELGFVGVIYYTDKAELDAAWGAIRASEDRAEGESAEAEYERLKKEASR